MLTIRRSTLPVEEQDLRNALANYQAALEAHKTTVGIPAPWPAFDVLRDIVASGGELAVEDDPPLEAAAEPPPEQQLRAKRNAAVIALLDLDLALAMGNPDAPEAVKQYKAAVNAATPVK